MCLQWIRYFLQHQLSLVLRAFSLPLLFKDRKIINKTSTNDSAGSKEKGLLRDTKLSPGDSVEEEDPEQNHFRVWNATQVLLNSTAGFLPSTRRTENPIYNLYIFSGCLPQTISHFRNLILIICSLFSLKRFMPNLSLIIWAVFTQEKKTQHSLCLWGHCISWVHGVCH